MPTGPTIAVLPFQNMSGDPEQEYFADGMTDSLITDLSQLREIMVIARNSAFTFKGKNVDVRQVGRELGEPDHTPSPDRPTRPAQLAFPGTYRDWSKSWPDNR